MSSMFTFAFNIIGETIKFEAFFKIFYGLLFGSLSQTAMCHPHRQICCVLTEVQWGILAQCIQFLLMIILFCTCAYIQTYICITSSHTYIIGTFLLSTPFGSGKLGEDEEHKNLTGLQYFKMLVAILRSRL